LPDRLNIGDVYNMDCIKGMQMLPEKSIDLIITDPPFAIDFKAKRTNYNRTEVGFWRVITKYMRTTTTTSRTSGWRRRIGC